MHFLGGNAVVLQSESNILRNGQSDELAVGILKHCANRFGQTEQTQLLGILARNSQAAGNLAGVGVGDQAVDTVGQGGLTAAGGTGDQHLLTLADLQIDIVESRLRLGGILKTEVFKGDNGFFFQMKTS